jgi:alpha-beta hydrolase superfamily lysophospholipase
VARQNIATEKCRGSSIGAARSKKILFLGAYHEILLESDSIRDFALAALRNFVQHTF